MRAPSLHRTTVIALLALGIASARVSAAPVVTGGSNFHPRADVPTDIAINFPDTPVGSSSFHDCSYVCFRQPSSPNGTCDASGTITLDRDVSPPFEALNFTFTLASETTCPNHAGGSGSGTPVSLPASVGPGERIWFDVSFSPTSAGTFSDNLVLAGLSFDLTGSTGNAPGGCSADAATLCIDDAPGDQRFEIRSQFSSPARHLNGAAAAAPLSPIGITQGGVFAFFSGANPEMLIKVLNACSLGGHYWVFFAAVTDVGFTVTVRDTVTGQSRTYSSADGVAALPVQDTSALPCS